MNEDNPYRNDETETFFYSLVGQSISIWSETEGLVVIVGALLLGTTVEKAGLAFYSITNFYLWLTIIDELFMFDKDFESLKPAWGEIAESLKKLNDTRVRLAHHSCSKTERKLQSYPALRPNRFDFRSKSRKNTPLDGEELVAFVQKVTPLIGRISGLIVKMVPIYYASTPPSARKPFAQDFDLPPPEDAQ